MLLITTLKRLKQEEQEFKASLEYRVDSYINKAKRPGLDMVYTLLIPALQEAEVGRSF